MSKRQSLLQWYWYRIVGATRARRCQYLSIKMADRNASAPVTDPATVVFVLQAVPSGQLTNSCNTKPRDMLGDVNRCKKIVGFMILSLVGNLLSLRLASAPWPGLAHTISYLY